jgi:DNA-binding NtrC family response regulator
MLEKSLEKVLKEKVEPIIEEAMQKFLGASIAKIGEDISDRIESNPLINFEIDTALSFKAAKKFFKKQFITRMIRNHYGNISEVARISDVDRRSVHRAVLDLNIDVEKVRKEMIRPDYYKKEAVDGILRKTFDSYKEVIHPHKLELMYAQVPSLSENIVRELPERELTWKEAEREFEKQYLKKALEEDGKNISKVARKIGLRYETLYRKIKSLGLKG